MAKLKVGILISGRGSNMAALIRAAQAAAGKAPAMAMTSPPRPSNARVVGWYTLTAA